MSQILETSAKQSGYKFHKAASGTIYLTKENVKIRIGDHEPNDSLAFMRGGKPTLEIYTKGAGGEMLLNNDAEICEKLSEMVEDFQLTPAAKAAITRNDNERARVAKLAIQVAERSKEIAAENAVITAKIQVILETNNAQVMQMLADAEAYSQKGSNGDKRRKLRKAHFSKAFEAAFGFPASPGDIKF